MQAAKAAPSSLHSKLEPASVEVKLKLGPVTFDGLGGPEVIVVSGAPRSIVHVWLAAVRSVFPAGSIARTWNVWLPAVKPV